MKRLTKLVALPMLVLAGNAHASLTTATQQGFRITWQELPGAPSNVRMVAACPTTTPQPTIYVTKSNPGGGSDLYRKGTGASYFQTGTLSALTRGIACAIVPSLTEVVFQTQYSGSYQVYESTNHGMSWTAVGTPQANMNYIQSGVRSGAFEEGLIAWFSGGTIKSFRKTSGVWSWHTFAATAPSAAEVTQGLASNGNTFKAYYRDASNKTLWYRKGGLASANAWLQISSVTGSDQLQSISAASTNVLFATAAGRLYQADITEDNCSDGLDNDDDGVTDGSDVDCL